MAGRLAPRYDTNLDLRTSIPDKLLTVFTPPAACETGGLGPSGKNVQRIDAECYPGGPGTYFFSPGLYCPSGYIANHDQAVTEFGFNGAPETTVICEPRGFTRSTGPSSIDSEWWISTATVPLTARSTASNNATIKVTTVNPPIATAVRQITLAYVSGDLSPSFSAIEGARYMTHPVEITPPPSSNDLLHVPGSGEPTTRVTVSPGPFNSTSTAAGIGIACLILATIALIAFRNHHRRTLQKNGEIARPRRLEPVWRIGAVPTLPALLSLPVGVFALAYGYRRDWQEDMILRWESKNAVLRFMQILSFFERLCATTLAWSIARDSGWLLLAIGMPAIAFIGVWNMSAMGGSYMSLINALWNETTNLTFYRWILFLLLVLLTAGADLTGNAMIASTGIANSTGSLPEVNHNLCFTSIIRDKERAINGGPESIFHIYSAGTSYPHILRHEAENITAFLPIQVDSTAPSYYDGAALFGIYETRCQLVPVTGNVTGGPIDFTAPGDKETSISRTRWSYDFNVNDLDLTQWGYKERPDPLQGVITISTGQMELEHRPDKVLLGNITTVITVPWNKEKQDNLRKRIRDKFAGLYVNMTEEEQPEHPHTRDDPLQDIHLFAAIRLFPKGVGGFTSKVPPTFGNTSTVAFSKQSKGTIISSPFDNQFDWEFQLCRTRVPYRVGRITTRHISRDTYPVAECDESKTQFCPRDLRYRAANFSTITWKDKVELSNLKASSSDKNTAWTAIKAFDPIIWRMWRWSNDGGVSYCYGCRAGNMASKYFAQLVADANTTSFEQAFSGSLMHAIAGTYAAQLPFFEGTGRAEWALPKEVSLVINHRWLWIGVSYTWFLVIVAVALRLWVLKIVGVERSGSTLAIAALLNDPNNPLQPLVQSGDMHRKSDFDIDMMERPELWNQKIKLGVLPNGRYGIGRADEVGGLRRRVRNSMLIAPMVQSSMMMAPMAQGDRERGMLMGDGSGNGGIAEKIAPERAHVQESPVREMQAGENSAPEGSRGGLKNVMRKWSDVSKMSSNTASANVGGSGARYERARRMSDVSEDSLQVGANR